MSLPPIIIINLEKDKDRLENAFKQLVGLDAIRYPAVNGKELDLNQIDITPYTRYLINHPNNRCSHQQINSVGGVGCYLSHCNVWNLYQDASSGGGGGVIIFEDDLKVCDDFAVKLVDAIANVPSDCDVLSFGYLGLLEKSDCDSGDTTISKDLFKSSSFFFGLQGYYISHQGMKKLLQHAFPIEVHLDAYIALAAKQGWINLYFTKNSMVQQCNVISNITDNYCYKCLLPNVSINGLIGIGIFIVLIILIVVIVFNRNRRRRK